MQHERELSRESVTDFDVITGSTAMKCPPVLLLVGMSFDVADTLSAPPQEPVEIGHEPQFVFDLYTFRALTQ